MLKTIQSTEDLKTCCAALYESDWARLLLGDSFHPGGLTLTKRAGTLLGLKPGQRLLDVAAGQGTSALFLARQFGCQVVGVDYGADAVAQANDRAKEAGLAGLVRFEQGDAECLSFADESFDFIMCECAFCTFPDKPTAAAEFSRVLRPGGRLGLSDLTRSGPLPQALEGLLAWIACLADARPLKTYITILDQAGFAIEVTEAHDTALLKMVQDIQTRLMGAELIIKLNKLDFPLATLEEAKALARSAGDTVAAGKFGYTLLIGSKLDANNKVNLA